MQYYICTGRCFETVKGNLVPEATPDAAFLFAGEGRRTSENELSRFSPEERTEFFVEEESYVAKPKLVPVELPPGSNNPVDPLITIKKAEVQDATKKVVDPEKDKAEKLPEK